MSEYRIVPVEPTEAMIRECQGDGPEHPVIKYLTPAERSGPLFPLAMYRANIAVAPFASADDDLVERAAREAARANGYDPDHWARETRDRHIRIASAVIRAIEFSLKGTEK